MDDERNIDCGVRKSLPQRMLGNIRAWFSAVQHELKTDTSSGICHASAAAACLIATGSFLYSFISLVVAYATGSIQFSISATGTSFSTLYLAGLMGFSVALLIGIMLVSGGISYARKSTGVFRVLGAVLTGLLAISYAASFLFVGDAGIVVHNALVNPLVSLSASTLSALSLNPLVILSNAVGGIATALYIPYIILPPLVWRSDCKTLLITSLKTVLCIHVLFRLILWIGDNVGAIVGIGLLAGMGILLIWMFSGGSDTGDHSIFTNDIGERIKVSFLDNKWTKL